MIKDKGKNTDGGTGIGTDTDMDVAPETTPAGPNKKSETCVKRKLDGKTDQQNVPMKIVFLYPQSNSIIHAMFLFIFPLRTVCGETQNQAKTKISNLLHTYREH